MTYVRFTECSAPKLKTRRWEVHAIENDTLLGRVQWRSGWRCYVFEPSFPTVFEQDCLRDIACFIENSTIRHKEKT